jgi:hypothetical protein
LTCTAEAHPAPSFEIFFNKAKVTSDKMYHISKVNDTDVGNYTCVASNILGNKTSNSEYLSLEGNNSFSTDSGRIIESIKYCAFCEESTILTGCVDFDTSMNIRCRDICEINAISQRREGVVVLLTRWSWLGSTVLLLLLRGV